MIAHRFIWETAVPKEGTMSFTCFWVGAIVALAAAPAHAQSDAPLRVMGFSGSSSWPIFVAQEKGLFAHHGVEVALIDTAQLSEAPPLLTPRNARRRRPRSDELSIAVIRHLDAAFDEAASASLKLGVSIKATSTPW